MNKKYLDTISEVFDESGSPSKEKLMGLMDETMAFFQEIKAKMDSDDPAKQEEAIQETMAMKQLLESKMENLSEKTGLNINELAALAASPLAMSEEEREAIESAKAKLDQLQQEDSSTPKDPLKMKI